MVQKKANNDEASRFVTRCLSVVYLIFTALPAAIIWGVIGIRSTYFPDVSNLYLWAVFGAFSALTMYLIRSLFTGRFPILHRG